MSHENDIEFVDDVEIVDAEAAEVVNAVEVIDDSVASPSASPCNSCGAPLDNNDQFCGACGAPASERAGGDDHDQKAARKYFECKACGNQIALDPDVRSYTCAFCDSNYVVEFSPDQSDRQPPEFIIGFAFEHHQALEKYQNWIKSNRWFHPRDLKHTHIADKLLGVYLPFWSFSMRAESTWSANIGEYWYRTETYTTTDANGKTVTRTRRVRETEWFPLSGMHHRYYSGYMLSASNGLPQEIAQRVMPFDIPALKRYEPYFLAGWQTQEYTLERDQALSICKGEYQNQERNNIAAFLPGDTYSNLRISSRFSQVSSDLCLLPYFLLTYQYEKKKYRFVMNGQTGRIWGTKPLSSKRIGVAIGLGLLAILLIVLAIWFFSS